MSLCEAEKTFVLHGVQENFRVDGRERGDYRPIELETNLVAHAFGSARLRLANTDVLVAVKLEIDTPNLNQPNEGKIEFFVDCSANATPDFEGRGGEDLALEISAGLASAYKSSNSFDATKLCILRGRKCWKVYVDILILECGGNLFDAVSLAVKAALYVTRIPKVRSVIVDGSNVEMDVSEELHDCIQLDISAAPVMVTICKIGDHCIVDPNSSEEQCSGGAVVVAVANEKFTTIFQTGGGSLHATTMKDSLKLGLEVAKKLDNALMEILLTVKDKSENVGFLN